MKISMDKIIMAMSTALDLAQMSSRNSDNDKQDTIIEKITNVNYSNHKYMHHSRRTAYIAIRIANYLNLNEENKKEIYISALLHDIGAANCFKESHHSTTFIKQHCKIGANIIKPLPRFKKISKILLYHHENFNGSGAIGIKGSNIPLESQIIRISDLIEILYKEDEPTFKQRKYIQDWVKKQIEIIFSPKIANAVLDISSKDIFWFDINNICFTDVILDRIKPELNIYLNLDEFQVIAEIFANIIDDKSKFTARHSKGIANLAYEVSKYIGFNEEKCVKMRIAGLLHDIGKLAIPLNILDKDGPLNNEEFEIIKSHVYYTKIILDEIEDINDISTWASNHHEKLNGHGYPAGLTAKDLSEESRILGVCDIYQALTEDRPYRSGLGREKSFDIIQDMVNSGFVCGKAFSNLRNTLISSHKFDEI